VISVSPRLACLILKNPSNISFSRGFIEASRVTLAGKSCRFKELAIR